MTRAILNLIRNLLECNLYASTQELFDNAYRNRIIGFRSEIEFSNSFNKGQLFEGGYILPTVNHAATLDSPIYFTNAS